MKVLLTLALAALTLPLAAQVGVNQPAPEQALDVNGKVRLGDDATAPTAGTLRYNAADGRFEGHDGSDWTDLGAAAAGALPTGPTPVTGYASPPTNGLVLPANFLRAVDRSPFTQVPAGKILVITSINVIDAGANPGLRYDLTAGPRRTLGQTPSRTLGYTLQGVTGNSHHVDGALAPLIVAYAGEYLNVLRGPVSGTAAQADLQFRGFLVDDLEY